MSPNPTQIPDPAPPRWKPFPLAGVLAVLLPIQVGMGAVLFTFTTDQSQWLYLLVQALILSLIAVPALWWMSTRGANPSFLARPADLSRAHARLRWGYGAILTIIAFIIVCRAWVLQQEIAQAKGRGALIESADRQRTAGEALARLVTQTAARSESVAAEHNRLTRLAIELRTALDAVERDAADLRDARVSLVTILADAHTQVQTLAAAARSIEDAANARGAGPDATAIVALQWLERVQVHQNAHARAMDRAIATLALTADARVLGIARISLIASALLLAFLSLAVCLVLEPAARVLEQQTRHIQEQQQALRASEQRFRALVEDSDVIVWEFDPRLNAFTYVSPHATRMGYAIEQWLQPGFFEAHLHPQDRVAALAYCKQETDAGRNHRLQYRMLQADGGIVWIDDWVSVESLPDGARLMRGVFADITELKRAQETLRDTEERWNMALQGSGDGVWDWDVAAGRIYRSPSWKETLGFTADEISTQAGYWEKLIHPEDRARARAALDGHLDGRLPAYRSEHRMRCKDGAYKWVLARGKVLRRSTEGRPLRMVGTQTDISAQKALQDELHRHHNQLQVLVEERTADLTRAMQDAEAARVMAERANKSKSMFLANMSHELRTPMHAILSFAHLGATRHAELDSSRLGDYFQRIEASGNRLLKLLNDLLDLSKLESGRALIQPEWISGSTLARSVAEELEPLLHDGRHALRIHAACEPEKIWLDGERMRQVLRNLIANAIRYSPDGGAIDVRIERSPTAGASVVAL
ncbi:MAG: PAS domain-containing protein, partial [Burkholderiales bacterium]